jgi:subtilisin-like proprotein convertase family protein
MNFDGDVDIGNNTLTAGAVNTGPIIATSVSATEFVGDGSKLTGISSPQGDCAVGTVVTGIKADGTITCGDVASSLPKDALDDVSNGVITNEFVDSFSPASMPIPIKDNFPVGTSATIVVPDVGLAKTMTIKLKLTNSDIADLQIFLFDPNNLEYTLYNKASSGGTFEATFPDPDAPEQGDLTTWYGKNLAGNWLLKVVDTKFLNNTDDGEITEFSVNINTVSNKKLDVKSLNVTGDLTTKGVTIDGDLNVNGTIAVNGSPWALMFPPGSRPFLYGFKEDRFGNSYQDGAWDYAYGHSVPIDNVNLHRCCNEIRWGDANGNIYQMRGGDTYADQNDEDTQQVLVAFVKNTTADPIQHTVHYRYTSNNDAGNHAGLGINTSNAWNTTSNAYGPNSTALTFPADQSSTVVLKVGSWRWTQWNGEWTRSIVQYYNNSWDLPEGLEWDYERYYQYVANIDP